MNCINCEHARQGAKENLCACAVQVQNGMSMELIIDNKKQPIKQWYEGYGKLNNKLGDTSKSWRSILCNQWEADKYSCMFFKSREKA